MSKQDQDSNPPRRKSFGKIFLSAMSAAFGVQSSKNHETDFSHSSPWPYIVAGVTFTVIFVLVLVTVVKVAIA